MSLIFDEVISAQSCVSQEVYYHGQYLCTYDPLMLKDFLSRDIAVWIYNTFDNKIGAENNLYNKYIGRRVVGDVVTNVSPLFKYFLAVILPAGFQSKFI